MRALARRRIAPGDALVARRRSAFAVVNALRSLAERQAPDGTWTGEKGAATGDVRLTALALLPFLWTGHTHRDFATFGRTVASGLRALKGAQRADGSFDDELRSSETDALATLAFLEAYFLTGSALYRGPAQQGLKNVARTATAERDAAAEPSTWSSVVLETAREVVRDDAAAGRPASFEVPAPPEGGGASATPDGARVPEGVFAAIDDVRKGGAAGEAWADVFERLALTQEQETDDEDSEPRGFWHGRDGRDETETTAIFALLLAAEFRYAPEPASGAPGR
jgi:hypothetical protein